MARRPGKRYVQRTNEWHSRIERQPDILGGKPVIRGTRVSVEQILREAARGLSTPQIVEHYPRLVPEDVRAAGPALLRHEPGPHSRAPWPVRDWPGVLGPTPS